jgi:hypothetical protein
MLAWFALVVAVASATPSLPKHVVMIVVDDLGWSDVSYTAALYPALANLTGVLPPTPNIDGLANAGVRLESYYTHPLCSPSRAAVRRVELIALPPCSLEWLVGCIG